MRDDEARFAPRSQGCCTVGSGVDRLGEATLAARSPTCRSKKQEAQKRAGNGTAAIATKYSRGLTFGRSKEQEASMKKADEGRERRGACPNRAMPAMKGSNASSAASASLARATLPPNPPTCLSCDD